MDTQAVTYAGFWKRFAAYLIDTVIMGIAAAIIIVPTIIMLGLGVAMTAASEEPHTIVSSIIGALAAYFFVILLVAVGKWLYYALMESSGQQGTLGKMALGIKVTDLDGKRVSFGRATGRYFARIISSLTLGIGYIIAGFTDRKQALHDMIASCLVVNK